MSEITLIRHGQASFGSQNYDQLSTLGQQQAIWLGTHWQQLNANVERIVIGSMVRHRQTAEGILQGLERTIPLEVHEGLNEYNFQGLLNPLRAQYPQLWQETGHAKRDYYVNMKHALGLWMDGTIDNDGQDSWSSFCQRIREGFQFAYQTKAKRTLVISSGGPISVILADVLKHDHDTTRNITLQIKNSSCSKLLYNGKNFSLDSFNDISHLLTTDKQSSITFS
ncbi:MAG: histidine phosphatase family protein [Spongiibacteraceae bacterium]